MSNHEEFNDRLDTEFNYFLSDMEPYVLKNPSKIGMVYGFHACYCCYCLSICCIDGWGESLMSTIKAQSG